jgi:hypothetical protein
VLAAGYESALHNPGLTPLHRLWKRTVAPVWEQDPNARLYLVVLDGCSYPVFLELLHALAQDSTFPIGVRPDPDGSRRGMPALAPLPTSPATPAARSSSASSRRTRWSPRPSSATRTKPRPTRPASTKTPRSAPAAASCSSRATSRTAARPSSPRSPTGSLDIVAAVFNAVDDQIGSANTGATVRLSPEDITAFKPSLRGALNARRKILITADHGTAPISTRACA